jgi:hypothetical protein
MSVLDQLTQSNLSLDGTRGYSNRKFGFTPAPSPISSADATALHRDYSAFENPKTVQASNFNGDSVLNSTKVSSLDETDPNAPKNLKAAAAGFQTYKSTPKQTYTDKGPVGGHY